MDSQTLLNRKRKERDIKKLMIAGYKIEFEDASQESIIVGFNGPKDTLYDQGAWQIRVYLPESYPYKSPSIGFLNKMFHPNVDFQWYKKFGLHLPRCHQSNLDAHVRSCQHF